MRLGSLALELTRGRRRFHPSSLFASGEAGAWYDPSDLSSMFQDSAGTTAAAVDSPVGYIADKSGNGNHAKQATAAARPLLRQDASGRYYLELDGVDDHLVAPFTISQPWDRISALQQVTWTDSDWLFAGGSTVFAGILSQQASSPTIGIYSGTNLPITGPAIGSNAVVSERHAGASSKLTVNSGSAVTGDAGIAVPGGITIGADSDGSNAANGRFYGTAMIGRALNDLETSRLRSFMAEKSGVAL